MKVQEVTHFFEKFSPLSLQEEYDNAGLLVGNPGDEVSGILVALDITRQVLDEAIEKNCNLIISHHPLIFKGIKSFASQGEVEKLVVKAIKNDIAIYSLHTNLDNVIEGVNGILARKIGLINPEILNPLKNRLRKLVTFCPVDHAEMVRNSIFDAGGGHIGNYDSCSFNTEGKGSFRAGAGTDPFVGERDKVHFEPEIRIEIVFPDFIQDKIIQALLGSHPYEEVAYDIYQIENAMSKAGAGIIGELEHATDELDFLKDLKVTLNVPTLRHSRLLDKKIKKVAICGGSGSFLIGNAKRAKADIFITGDLKYHQFFEAEDRILLVDAGHFETEQFTKDLIINVLKENFPNFALLISEVNTNPVNYF
jgi:dinuclear metal center YbgI/SA1388 family protein